MKAGRWFFIASLVVLCGIIIYYTTVVLNILSIPLIGIILWSVVIVFCLRGIVDGLEKRAKPMLIGTIVAYLVMLLVLAACIFLDVLALVRRGQSVRFAHPKRSHLHLASERVVESCL